MEINIGKYISELLYHHDCIIIPGFGGFIGNYSPAVINPVHHTFYPPFKSLLFNIHLKQNDGLLAARISQGEGITYEIAMEHIGEMVKSWNHLIEMGQELVIDKVGKITPETENTLQFEQDFSINYLPDAFGLTSFVSPAIRRPGLQGDLEKKISRYIAPTGSKHRMIPKTLKWAAILTLPIGVAVYFSLTNIDKIRNFSELYSGILFTSSDRAAKKVFNGKQLTINTERKTVNTQQSVVGEVEQPVDSSTLLNTVSPEPGDLKISAPVSQSFAIIVGAFRLRENADNLVSKLREEGYDAFIHSITTTGLFRVSVGAYDNKMEAFRRLAMVRTKDCSSAWLLQK